MTSLHDDSTSSPSRPPEDSIAYYKSQYEQLEAELADFQASSKELEAELEKDVEAAESRERQLKEKVEGISYEADEWKSKYKQAKAEANTVQGTLQKEITSLREINRTTQAKLRDIEVSNDDFEKQARNTTSSLEDLESKYNQAIERAVLADEEIKAGEQEREALRIETQRLRDELNDLKIEAEIRQGKLRNAEAAAERHRPKRLQPLDVPHPPSEQTELSPTTSASSPTIVTPPTKSESSNASETPTPPSPPTSDRSMTASAKRPLLPTAISRISSTDDNLTPRPSQPPSRMPRHSRGPSLSLEQGRTPSYARRTTLGRPEAGQRGPGIPSSGSLHHLHGLMSKMQMLEKRVHSARSKLPAPTSTPPRASPRGESLAGQTSIPHTVTVRSNRKRTGGSNISQIPGADRPSSRLSSTFTPNPDRPASRLSFGFQQASPLRESQANRPPSRDMHNGRPPSRDAHSSRPSSRASLSSRQSISHLPSAAANSSRPSSRQSMSGSRTPLGHYATISQSESRRPRSSMGGSYANGHSHSSSVSRLSNYDSTFSNLIEDEGAEVLTPTPSRRSVIHEGGSTAGFAAATSSSSAKRLSGITSGKRITPNPNGEMKPPERKAMRRLSGVGETY